MTNSKNYSEIHITLSEDDEAQDYAEWLAKRLTSDYLANVRVEIGGLTRVRVTTNGPVVGRQEGEEHDPADIETDLDSWVRTDGWEEFLATLD